MGFDAERDEYRHAIVQRAVDRRSELTEVIVTNILTELPEYANGRSAGELEDIRVGVQHSIDLCLATIRHGLPLTEDERAILRCTGGQRARQGIPKPVMLSSVKIATRVGRAFLMTCTDVGDDAEVLMGAFRHITEILDRFEDEACAALADGHDEGWGQVLSAGDRGEAVLVDRLLEHRFEDKGEVLAHAAGVGLSRFRQAHVVVVAALGALDEQRLRATASELRTEAMSAVGPLRFTHQYHVPMVVQPRDRCDWLALVDRFSQVAHRHRTTVVFAEHAADLTELWPAYRLLREGLPYLPAATTNPGAVPSVLTRFHRVTCSGTSEERLELMAEILRPLQRLPQREAAELFEALDALYETGGSSAALARHLHLHKNTVGNRIRRIQEVAGLDVRRPPERLVLEAALRMRHVADLLVLQSPAREWTSEQTG